MFTDARSKRLVLVAHCVLNQNAISDGTADFAGTDVRLVQRLLEAGVGIVQLPCPELNCLGLDRGDPLGAERPLLVENSRIRRAMGAVAPARLLSLLAERAVYEIEQYRLHGFTVLGIVGINRSPSCGVDSTSRDDQEARGQGVFMEALAGALAQRGLAVPMIGVKASEPDASLRALGALLG